jgi:hypothetical protein
VAQAVRAPVAGQEAVSSNPVVKKKERGGSRNGMKLLQRRKDMRMCERVPPLGSRFLRSSSCFAEVRLAGCRRGRSA